MSHDRYCKSKKDKKTKEVGNVPLESYCYYYLNIIIIIIIIIIKRVTSVSMQLLLQLKRDVSFTQDFFSIIALKVCNHRPN